MVVFIPELTLQHRDLKSVVRHGEGTVEQARLRPTTDYLDAPPTPWCYHAVTLGH